MKITVIPGEQPNAFVKLGRDEIFVTTTGMKTWTKEELKGVIAHEEAHIKQYHVQVKLVLGICISMYRLVRLFKGRGWRGRFWDAWATEVVVMNSCAYITERLADKAAKDNGYGPQLASALAKMPSAQFHWKLIGALMGQSHPSTKSRIKRALK